MNLIVINEFSEGKSELDSLMVSISCAAFWLSLLWMFAPYWETEKPKWPFECVHPCYHFLTTHTLIITQNLY